MARPLWFVDLLKRAFPSRFRAAKLTRLPIIGRIVDYVLFEGDDVIYLPRDNVIQVDQPIEGSEDVVLPSQVVTYFIEQSDHHPVIDFCICHHGRYKNLSLGDGFLYLP